MRTEKYRPFWAPTDEGGGEGGGDAAAAAAAAAGNDTAAGGSGNDTAAGGGGNDSQPGGGAGKWWEDNKRFDEAQRQHLTVKGLTTDDPLEALSKLTTINRHAETRLGRPADQLIDRPGKDQPIAEWKAANRELFGIPENPGDYKIEKPKDWPENLPWNDAGEQKLRETAIRLGLSNAEVQEMVNLQAGEMMAAAGGADAAYEAAAGKLRGDLIAEWGDHTDAKIERAKRGLTHLATEAGLSDDEKMVASRVINRELGDASTMKLFAALGDMMADDQLMRGGGGPFPTIGVTPADARAELARMEATDGDYAKAVQLARGGDRSKLNELQPRVDQLRKIAAG